MGDLVAQLLAGGRVLALADELFKGTNVMDASDATEAVVRGFARCDRSAFVVASHLAELAVRLGEEEGIRFAHFDAAVGGPEPRFTSFAKSY